MKNRMIMPTLLTVILVSLLTITVVKAQTSITFRDTNDNFVLEINNESENDEPVKIILVYDTNSIALETQKSGNSYNRNLYKLNNAPANPLSASENFMAVDIERDIELEDWMLTPFNYVNSVNNYSLPDNEEEIPLESWMSDLNEWM